MSHIHILAEGQTEIHLLSALNSAKQLKLAKIHTTPFNCWNHGINKRLIKLTKKEKTTVVIVYDVDVLEQIGTNKQKLITTFISNIQTLLTNGYQVILLQQTDNFEDELVSATNCRNQKQLFNHFNATSNSEFKDIFLRRTNILEVLSQISFLPDNMWTKQTHQQLMQILNYKNCLSGNWIHVKNSTQR